jgi:hypothetical protein
LVTQPQDQHTIINTTTHRFQAITQNVARLLQQPVCIQRASEVFPTSRYQALMQGVKSSFLDEGIDNTYHLLQVTDALYFSNANPIAKVSWRTKPQDITANYEKTTGLPKGTDESGFDSLIRYFLPQSHFILTPTGKTADPKRPNVSPYASSHPELENRVFFGEDYETVGKKIESIRNQSFKGGNTGKTSRNVLSRYADTLSLLGLGLSDEPLEMCLFELMQSLDR